MAKPQNLGLRSTTRFEDIRLNCGVGYVIKNWDSLWRHDGVINRGKILTYFCENWWFLRILTILGVACHVRISAIGSKNHANPHGRSLAIKIELYKIRNPPQPVFTSSQFFLLLKFFLEPNFKPHLLPEQKDNQDLDPSVGKLNKFAIRKVRNILCQIASFEVKNTTKTVNFVKNQS